MQLLSKTRVFCWSCEWKYKQSWEIQIFATETCANFQKTTAFIFD